MFLLEAEYAIYKRLTGYPLDSQGRPLLGADNVPVNREVIGPPDMYPNEKILNPVTLEMEPQYPLMPSYGVRLPLLKAPSRPGEGLITNNPSATRALEGYHTNSIRQVPVFDLNAEGREWSKIWPCVTFKMLQPEFDPRVYIYHDPFGAEDLESPRVDIRNKYGDIIKSGYDKSTRRPHPESWVAEWAIVARSKSQVELALLCSEIIKLFPARGALLVDRIDGTRQAVDMIYRRSESDDEGGDRTFGTASPDNQRGLARAFIYAVELYFDNSGDSFGVQDSPLAATRAANVSQRIVELFDLQSGLVETPATDVNLQELDPIT